MITVNMLLKWTSLWVGWHVESRVHLLQLIRIIIYPRSGSIHSSVTSRPLASARVNDRRSVEDGLIVLRIELHEECLPFLNQLKGC